MIYESKNESGEEHTYVGGGPKTSNGSSGIRSHHSSTSVSNFMRGGESSGSGSEKYVGNLWDRDALHRRVDNLLEIEDKMGVTFRE